MTEKFNFRPCSLTGNLQICFFSSNSPVNFPHSVYGSLKIITKLCKLKSNVKPITDLSCPIKARLRAKVNTNCPSGCCSVEQQIVHWFLHTLFIYLETKIISNGDSVSLTSGWGGSGGGMLARNYLDLKSQSPSQNLRLVNHPRTAVGWVSLSSLKKR